MKIGDFSDLTKLSVMTIRYYMSLGLFSPQKAARNWDFTEDDLVRAEKIKIYKQCGFSLEEITELVNLGTDGQSISRMNTLAESQRQNILQRRLVLEDAMEKLNRKVNELEQYRAGQDSHGIPLRLFALIECPYCSRSLHWEHICVDYNQITSGEARCSCGFHASVEDGILVSGNCISPIIKPVDTKILTLRNRSAKDTTYIEGFNQWLFQRLKEKKLYQKIIYEDVLDTYSFLNKSIPQIRSEALYILCDTSLDVVRYYKDCIHSSCPDAQVLFMADDGIHHALKKNCIDIVIDCASSEVYQKFGYASSSACLQQYVHPDSMILGRFSCLIKKQPGIHNPEEINGIRYNLSVLQRSLNDSGVRIDDEKYGNENVDPRVYNGCLPGDIIKPYAFVGHWQ